MTSALERMAGELAGVKAYGRRSRKWLVFDIALSVALGALGAFTWAQQTRIDHASAIARHNQVTISQLHASEIKGCKSGNQARVAEIALWTHIYQLSVTKHTPAKIRAEDIALISYIRRTFAPRDCAAVYRLP
jgi:hypothetical protein